MSYLFPEGSLLEPGVVQVGANIDIADGVISLPQSVATTANITFNDIDADGSLNVASFIESLGNITTIANAYAAEMYDAGNRVITEITPAGGNGISITALDSVGPTTGFTVNNTGVLSLIAGSGITLSGSTGNITVSATGADIINTIGVTSNYTATATDEYIGVNSTSLVTITLPVGEDGRQYTVKEERGSGTGKVNVQGSSSEKIDGSAFKQLSANASLTVVFRAGVWRII
jgi:hypothetical protein